MNYSSHYVETGHDPVAAHYECEICNEILRRMFNELADEDLGPKDVDALIDRIRDIARST